MTSEVLREPFKLGVDPYPNWFKGLNQEAMDFQVRESDGALLSVTINLTGNRLTAQAGDTIGLIGRDIVVIPASAAKQFM